MNNTTPAVAPLSADELDNLDELARVAGDSEGDLSAQFEAVAKFSVTIDPPLVRTLIAQARAAQQAPAAVGAELPPLPAVAWRRATKHGWEYRSTAPTASTPGVGWLPLVDLGVRAQHAGAAAQDRKALEIANAALIASVPRFQENWARHEAAINATACALNKPTTPQDQAAQPAPAAQAVEARPDDVHDFGDMIDPNATHNMRGNRILAQETAPASQGATGAQGVVDVKRWQERMDPMGGFIHGQTAYIGHAAVIAARDAEIADLRAQLARQGQGAAPEQARAAAPGDFLPSREVADEIVLLSNVMRKHPQLKQVIGREALLMRCVREALASPSPMVPAASSEQGEKAADSNAGDQSAEQAFRRYIEVMADPCNEFMAEITVCRDARARRGFANRIREEAERLLAAYPPASRTPAADAGGHNAMPALRLVQELSRISMSLAADLVQSAAYTFQGHDYLDRDAVCERVMQWRNQWDATAPDRDTLAQQAIAPATSAAAQPVPQVGEQSAAARDVLAERRRQVEQEGWEPDQDDDYEDGQLSVAAACYAMQGNTPNYGPPADWPWDREWWKPSDDRRNLVKAGALILADIERLDRAAMQQGQESAKDGADGGAS